MEARTSLPLQGDAAADLETIVDGLMSRRFTVKADMQIETWDG